MLELIELGFVPVTIAIGYLLIKRIWKPNLIEKREQKEQQRIREQVLFEEAYDKSDRLYKRCVKFLEKPLKSGFYILSRHSFNINLTRSDNVSGLGAYVCCYDDTEEEIVEYLEYALLIYHQKVFLNQIQPSVSKLYKGVRLYCDDDNRLFVVTSNKKRYNLTYNSYNISRPQPDPLVMKLLAKTFKNKFKSVEVDFKVLSCPLTGEPYTKEEAMWCPECKVTVSPNVVIFQGKKCPDCFSKNTPLLHRVPDNA